VLPGHTASRFRQVGTRLTPDTGIHLWCCQRPERTSGRQGLNRAACGACHDYVDVDMPPERITSTCGSSTTFNDNQCADHHVSLVNCGACRAQYQPDTRGEL
jgi:hypothetical protein